MTEYYRNQYRSTPSRRVNGPVTMYPTRARRRRMVLLFTALATVVVIVLGSLAGLVWGVKGLAGGEPQSTGDPNVAAVTDSSRRHRNRPGLTRMAARSHRCRR